MKTNSPIYNELREVSPILADLQADARLSVPAGYFDHLSSFILQKIAAGQEAIYYFSKSTPYTVPNGYFDGLASQILQKVNQQSSEVYHELETVSPLLNTISKKHVYTVPEGYLNKSISAPRQKSTAKVVSIRKNFMRYAAAAVVTSVVAVSAFLFTKSEPPAAATTSGIIKKVDALSEEELKQYLQANMPYEPGTTSTSAISHQVEVTKTVEKMSDKEIQQYLAEIGETDEI